VGLPRVADRLGPAVTQTRCPYCGQPIAALSSQEIGALRARRHELGLRGKVVAGKIGVSATSLWHWETGLRRPSAEHHRAWRAVLEME
jgi:DNA-binding transcriptional regulator YiaG